MGKVKDEVSSSKPSEPSKGGAKKSGTASKGKPGGAPPGQLTLFLVNLARADLAIVKSHRRHNLCPFYHAIA